MLEKLLITNCRLFNSRGNLDKVSILINRGIIEEIGGRGKSNTAGAVLNAENRIIAPGFIDIHIQGAGGADVLDGTVESLKTISKTCAGFGTTSFIATTVYRSGGDNRHLNITAENTGKDLGGAQLLGTHLEGPFISHEKRGMILPGCVCAPSIRIFDDIQSHLNDTLKIMTIAPELDGGLDIIKRIAGSGKIASFGHSNATYEETLKGIGAGISHVTHLFNAMPSLHHRTPGPLLAIFKTEKLSVQVIPDGVHIHPRILKFTFELIDGDRCIPITDGMRDMGLPDGVYVYNGVKYESKNGTSRYFDGTLIGTSLGLIQLLLRLMEFTNCSLDYAIKTVTENPARALGIDDRKGTIAVGKDADLVILDHDYSIWSTVAGGKVVFKKI